MNSKVIGEMENKVQIGSFQTYGATIEVLLIGGDIAEYPAYHHPALCLSSRKCGSMNFFVTEHSVDSDELRKFADMLNKSADTIDQLSEEKAAAEAILDRKQQIINIENRIEYLQEELAELRESAVKPAREEDD
jgi:hypothetical protein